MTPTLATLVALLSSINTLTPAEVNRHGLALEAAINKANPGDEEDAISKYLLANTLAADKATADKAAADIMVAVNKAKAAAPVSKSHFDRRFDNIETDVRAAANRSNGPAWWGAIAASIAALIGLGLFLKLGNVESQVAKMDGIAANAKEAADKSNLAAEYGARNWNILTVDAGKDKAGNPLRSPINLTQIAEDAKAAAENSEAVYDATFVPDNCSKAEKDGNGGKCLRIMRSRSGINVTALRQGIREDVAGDVDRIVRDRMRTLTPPAASSAPAPHVGGSAPGASAEPARPRAQVQIFVPSGTQTRTVVNGVEQPVAGLGTH